MRLNDAQLGKPETLYKDTTVNIEAIASPVEGMIAYSTDDHLEGYYNGLIWVWDETISPVSTRWEPLTNGDPASSALIFDPVNGDVFMVEVII